MNKIEYQVTFSYDLNQTRKIKYDTFLLKSFEKIGGTLVEKYEDEYGGKDIVLNVKSDLTTLNKTIKEILVDLEKKDVKMNVSAHKIQHVVNIEQKQFSDFSSFQALVSGWASERNGRFENQGNSFNLIVNSAEDSDEFIKKVLPQSVLYTKDHATPAYFADTSPEPVIVTDNYNHKRKPTIA